MINPAWLKTFLELSECRNFTKTASHLGMTQPGVSQHIQQLENDLGTRLLNRSKKNVQLTPAGQKLKDLAIQLLSDLSRIKDRIGDDDPTKGLCKISSPGSFGIKMYSFLLSLQQKYPELCIHYEYRPNVTIIQDVLNERVDMGFITQGPTDNCGFEYLPFDQEQLCLIVPKTMKNIDFESLVKLGIIGHPDVSHHASRLLKSNFSPLFKSMEQFPLRGSINQITRILDPVALGLGFSALPECAVRSYSNQKMIRIVPLKHPVTDTIGVIWKKGKTLPARFEMILREYRKKYKPNF